MPRRNFREIDTNSSDRHFGTGDRFLAELKRSSCLRVSGVDLLPAERLALDRQCPSPRERTCTILSEYKWGGPFKLAWVEVLYVYVIWQVVHLSEVWNGLQIWRKNSTRGEEGERKRQEVFFLVNETVRTGWLCNPSVKWDGAKGASMARVSLKPCLPEGTCALLLRFLQELSILRPDILECRVSFPFKLAL